MKSLSKKRKTILIGVFSVIFVGAVFLFYYQTVTKNTVPEGMVEVPSYDPGGICKAFMPECGYCPGEVIENKCYVKQGNWEQSP